MEILGAQYEHVLCAQGRVTVKGHCDTSKKVEMLCQLIGIPARTRFYLVGKKGQE